MIAIAPPIQRFIGELKANPEFAGMAPDFRSAIEATELRADNCAHHEAFLQAISLICAEPRSIYERLEALKKIFDVTKKGRDQGGGIVTVEIQRTAS